jgi:glycosyltransferase involved in cell wall biosynthesis
MKIAILSQSYPPMISGAAIFVERLAEQMSARGHEVMVLTSSDQPYPYRVRKPNLRLERCRSYYNPWRKAQRFALWPHQWIWHRLAEFTPDVIHLHDPLQFTLSSLAFSRQRKTPVILTIHGLPWLVSANIPFGFGIQKIVEDGLWSYAQWVLKRCSDVVVATHTIGNLVSARTHVAPQVISGGVDLVTFSPTSRDNPQAAGLRPRLGIPENVPVILHVGRLDRDKRVERVVQAAALTMQDTPAHLLIVGDGTERAYLETLCDQLGISERSHFPGFITVNDGLPAVYQMSAVFVTASEFETQGLVLLEAAASGLPIVAVQATSLHEIVLDGENGFLLRCEDRAGMAERITELINNPGQAHKMGQMGRKIAENHTLEKTFTAYEDLYCATILKAKPSSSLKANASP